MHAIRTILIAVLLCLQSVAASAVLRIQHWTTANGVRVFFVENHDLPMLDVQVDFAAGWAFDDPAMPGVAAVTHALLDAGAGPLDEHALTDRFADVGAQISGALEADRASIKLRVLSASGERDPALEALRFILVQPRFEAKAFERERGRIIAELRESLTQPETIANRRFSALAYGNHPYGTTLTEAALQKLTRAQLGAFHRRQYVGTATTLTLVGDLTRADAERIATALVGGLPAGNVKVALPVPALPKAVTERVPHVATQAHVLIGQPGFRRGDADTFPLLVGNYVLGGGGFVSRLLKEVRDARGLSYSAYSYFMPQLAEGLFELGLQTRVEKADEAVKVAHDTLNSFLRDGPSEEELQAAKDNIINGFALRLDNNRKVLEQVAVVGFYGLPLDYLDTYPERVRAVTAAQVRDAFKRRLKPEAMVTVIVGGK